MNKLWTILCMNCKYNMYSLWMKYEQIVNKIIFILFFRTYIEARYIVVRYIMQNWTIKSVKWFYLTYYISASCQVILLDKISYNPVAKMQNIQVIVIFPPYFHTIVNLVNWGVFYIIKHLFDCETRAMCSTQT